MISPAAGRVQLLNSVLSVIVATSDLILSFLVATTSDLTLSILVQQTRYLYGGQMATSKVADPGSDARRSCPPKHILFFFPFSLPNASRKCANIARGAF